jgi:hypothetical protein
MDKIIYRFIFYLLFFNVFESYGQLMFSDDFENGQFAGWENAEHWSISNQSPIAGSYALKHNLSGIRSTSFISRKIPSIGLNDKKITWNFKLKNGNWIFAATEQVCFYLVSDQTNLTLANGYAIGVNLKDGDNVLKLCRMQNGKAVQDIILTDFVWKAGTLLEVEVKHEFGAWGVKYKDALAGSWSATKTGNEKTLNSTFDTIGLFYKFNSTHAGQIWMDDVSMRIENCHPAIYEVRSSGKNLLSIIFSKTVSSNTLLNIDNYRIKTRTGNLLAITAIWKASGDTSGVYLRLGDFRESEMHLTLTNLTDSDGLTLVGNEFDFTFIPTAQFGDLVFNEMMADPSPVVKLPNKEFIELKNTCVFQLNLKNWILEVNGKPKILPEKIIDPGKYLIISGTGGSAIWGSFGDNLEVTGLSLPNDGEVVKLYSAANVLIDSFCYTPSMHRDGFSDGGYSLERIDPKRSCGVNANWETTISDKGGTPGTENSVYRDNPDNTPPVVTSVTVSSPALLEIIVSELPDIHLDIKSIFSFLPSLPSIDSIRFDVKQLKYLFYFPQSAIENGVVYDLTISGLMDECGNKTAIQHREFWYYLPKFGDLLINEVLFDPFPEGVDFVEIYNYSGKKIEMSEVYLASRDNTLKIKSFYPLSAVSKVLLDSQYAAFSSDSIVLLSNYATHCPACIFNMAKFPAYNLDEGWVVLLNKQMEVIDEFHYLASMHHPMITEVKGISLERSSFSQNTSDPSNWHSASKTVGFATPGYQNSNADPLLKNGPEIVTFEPEIFSPNGDGLNDRFLIKLSPGEPGLMANIRIYTEGGIEIRRLANNLMIGVQDVVEWDGLMENHQKAKLGIYIVKVELFGLRSKRRQFNAACVLTDRLK